MINQQYFSTLPSDQKVFEEITNERKEIGYYDLPFSSLEHLTSLDNFTQKHIVVIGIGGSSLGTYAIYNFLSGANDFSTKKKLHFLESTDPLSIKSKLKEIDLNDALFIIISKSGTTVETISIFKYIYSIIEISKNNCITITENDSALKKLSDSKDLVSFNIPKNVGGRFSVLSNVGLVPLYLMGVNIEKLLNGAKKVNISFFQKEKYYDLLINKARFIAENKDQYNINAIFSYSEMLAGFNKWYVQIWGESLGKKHDDNINEGLTPIGLLGPVDQHSFLQLIVEGRRDKTVTFIKIKDFNSDIKVPDISLENLETLDSLNNLDFAKLINMQADATIQSVQELKDIPTDVIECNEITENEIGKLIYYYELLTSLVSKFIGINAYDQPGVEFGKIILKDKLEKSRK